MKKAKFWLYQIIMVAIVSVVLGSPALADKPIEKQAADCVSSGGWLIDGQCSVSSTNSKGGGGSCSVKKVKGVCPDDTGSTDDGSTDDGSTDGTYGPCPEGMKWIDLYQMCITA